MNPFTWIDQLFLLSLLCIWLILLIHIGLSYCGYQFHEQLMRRSKPDFLTQDLPSVTILVPAHNEEKVIANTVRSLLALDYPVARLEIIIINDNSSDNTGEILKSIQDQAPTRNLKVITTDKTTGGKGKSNALNHGLAVASGEYIAVYDADNTPEKYALRYLVDTIIHNPKLGAVIGKFRARNKDRNLLTHFINIEGVSFQWIAQAGRWYIFRLCTIPGTNFIIRKSVLAQIGGWDERAVAEDTELSFNIYRLGYRIAFMPLAVTWEQEPENFRVWFKQRTRWVKGNFYVLFKNISDQRISATVLTDLFYYFIVYFLFSTSVIFSDFIFVSGLFFGVKLHISGNFVLIWLLAYLLFLLEVGIALTFEKAESHYKNFFLVALMYFSYSQLWLIVVLNGLFSYINDLVFTRRTHWYKTERF